MSVKEDEILARAHEWFAKQNLQCPRCGADSGWKIGKVTEVNQVRHNAIEGHNERAVDMPDRYAVPLFCGRCGSDFKHYEESEGRSIK
jgi:ribosomal protein S27AE